MDHLGNNNNNNSIIYMFVVPGLGSVSMEQMDNSTLEIVRAGDHWSRNMSKQMLPLLLMFG